MGAENQAAAIVAIKARRRSAMITISMPTSFLESGSSMFTLPYPSLPSYDNPNQRMNARARINRPFSAGSSSASSEACEYSERRP